MFSYQKPQALLLSRPQKGCPLFRFRRWEKRHRISESSEIKTCGLQDPTLSSQKSRLSFHWIRIALTTVVFKKEAHFLY